MIILSCILARGNSKAIPKKNIINLNGKPLISYSVSELHKCKDIDEVFVSTDNKEISDISKQYGAKVFNRDPKYALDTSSSEDALLEFTNKIKFDILVFVQCTSPGIKHEYINKGIEMVLSGQYDSVFSCFKQHWIPEYSLNLTPLNFKDTYSRRQDRESKLIDIGMFYVIKKEILLENKFRLRGKIGYVEIPLKDSFQIDNMEDLKLIEKLMK